MKPQDVEMLKDLIGRTVVEIRVSDDESDYGFEIVFNDGTTLEVYDLKCAAMSEECKKKKIRVVNFETGKSEEVSAPFVGGGVGWVVVKE